VTSSSWPPGNASPPRGVGSQASTPGSIAGGTADAGQVPTDAPASGVTVLPSAGVHPRGGPPLRHRSLPRFEAPRRIEGPGFSALFDPAPPVSDPGDPVLLTDDVADGTDTASLEAEAIRLGAVLLVVPAVPGTARARELSGPGWHVASDWYVGRSISDRR
jgi:hypothetical protein